MTTYREDAVKLNELRNECERLRRSENESRTSLRKMSDLEQLIVELRAEVKKEKEAKERANREKAALKKDADEVGTLGQCVTKWKDVGTLGQCVTKWEGCRDTGAMCDQWEERRDTGAMCDQWEGCRDTGGNVSSWKRGRTLGQCVSMEKR